ncbi:MAG: toll/interleukin-1 receptor domain-containing protein [Gemmatimonadota bacterium]
MSRRVLMGRDEPIKSSRIYLSYDSADSPLATQLQETLARRTIMCECWLRRYEDDGTNFPNLARLRTSQVVLFLMSDNSRSETGWLREHLWVEFVEALNYGKAALIFLFSADPGTFSPDLIEKISRPRRGHLILPDEKSGGVDQGSVLALLEDLGILVDKFDAAEKEDRDTPYDAFVSFKSEDQRFAQTVYDLLLSQGLRVFFSRESLPRLGSADYHREIDRAIDRASNMVVVGSSREHIESKWVEYEWRLFLGEKLAGRKAGNLVTVLSGDLAPSALPISLRNFEAVRLAPGEIERLPMYLRMEEP